jgi:hypothetical protein
MFNIAKFLEYFQAESAIIVGIRFAFQYSSYGCQGSLVSGIGDDGAVDSARDPNLASDLSEPAEQVSVDGDSDCFWQ